MKNKPTISGFGKRLAQLRKQKGLTQKKLAAEVGVSRRTIVYYEIETDYPPTHLILPFSKALGISADELLGITKSKEAANVRFPALWRRLKIIETFSDKDRKAVLQYVDLIAKKNKVERKDTATK